jgi:hypothetical protein
MRPLPLSTKGPRCTFSAPVRDSSRTLAATLWFCRRPADRARQGEAAETDLRRHAEAEVVTIFLGHPDLDLHGGQIDDGQQRLVLRHL